MRGTTRLGTIAWGLLGAAGAAGAGLGCGTDLSVPVSAQVRCDTDADCPSDFACHAGACVSLKVNQPPRLSLGTIARTLDALTIPVVVLDAESNAVSIAVEVRVDPAGDFTPIAVTGAEGIAASAAGAPADLTWTSAAADLAALGHQGYVGGLALRLTPRDELGPGAAVVSDEVAYGNDAPVVDNVTLDDDPVRGNTVVRFVVTDTAADRVAVHSFEFSAAGDFSDVVTVPITAGVGASFPGGAVAELATSSAGTAQNLTWASALGAALRAERARLRLRVVDAFGGVSLPGVSPAFVVRNLPAAPTLDVTLLPRAVTGPVQVSLVPADADGDRCTLFASYSTDYSTWTQALSADTLVGLTPGQVYPFTWSVAQLDPDYYPTVWLRLLVADTQLGEQVEVGPFVVDTRTATTVDTTPPSYVSPVGGVFANERVLLLWTSRLGAQVYTVEVARDAAFTDQVTDSPFATSTSELEVVVPEDITYYWRVRADVTAPGQYSAVLGAPASFDRLGDTVYVYCASTDPLCSNAGKVGNRSLPLTNINTALARAVETGKTLVKVAARGGAASYDGIVFMRNGVSIKGGYDPASFADATRDPAFHKTALTGGTSIPYNGVGLVAEGITAATELSGVRIVGPVADISYGLRVTGCSKLFVVRDSSIVASDGATGSTGISVAAGGLTLDNVSVTSGSGVVGTSYAVAAMSGADLVVIHAELNASPSTAPGGASALSVWGSTVNVVGSRLRAASGNSSSTVFGMIAGDGAVLSMSDSIVYAGPSDAAHAALLDSSQFSAPAQISVTGSILGVGAGLYGAPDGAVTFNGMFGTTLNGVVAFAPASNPCLVEGGSSAGASISAVKVLDCMPLYRRWPGTDYRFILLGNFSTTPSTGGLVPAAWGCSSSTTTAAFGVGFDGLDFSPWNLVGWSVGQPGVALASTGPTSALP